MLNKGASFARYSKNLCWFVAFIWLLLSVLTFTGGTPNAVLNGFLWLAGAFAFAISAIYLSKGEAAAPSDENKQ